MAKVDQSSSQRETHQSGPWRGWPGLQCYNPLSRRNGASHAIVAETCPDDSHACFDRGGSVGKRSFVRDTLDERQKSLALIPLTRERLEIP
jgi:hypothetical protein